MLIVYGYLAVISLAAVLLTYRDKQAARHNKRRIPEKTLFLTALLGGSVGMYLTMVIIRHKTRHKRFMWGLPLIIAVETTLFLFLFRVYLPQG